MNDIKAEPTFIGYLYDNQTTQDPMLQNFLRL